MSKNIYQILLPLPKGGPYDYMVPNGNSPALGDYVTVPLGRRKLAGVIWQKGGDAKLDPKKLKDVAEFHPLPPLPDVVREFISWVSQYNLQPIGNVLKLTIPVASVFSPPKREKIFPTPQEIKPDHKKAKLTPTQQAALEKILLAINAQKFSTLLLDGVTGAGKTEVYFEALAQVIRKGQQVLILLPEIALTQQITQRFAARFDAPPLLWHSQLTPTQRRHHWRMIASGQAQVVIGARSALFLPYPHLGLIIVDEEHESAYKQEEVVLYHARDMAIARAKLGEMPCLLVSATPALETLVNAQSGKYTPVHLPDRFGGARLPTIELIDLKDHPPPRQQFLAEPLRSKMREVLAAGEQILLYLNRRGYAPLVLCRGCGERLNCSYCSAWLVYHKNKNRVLCHHCGHGMPLPKVCDHCGAEDKFAPCGPGVERVAEEVAQLFPDAPAAILSSDNEKDIGAHLQDLADSKISIAIGTQLLAKGHHFPGLTLVGVVDGDLGLTGADLRAGERTFQLLYQVAGRAGRETKPGHVMIQTYQPQHPLFQALCRHDRDDFMHQEIEARRAANLPPFGHMAAIILAARDERRLHDVCQQLLRRAPREQGLRILGPAPAPLSKLRGLYRQRFLIMTEGDLRPQNFIRHWLARVPIPAAVRIAIDIDPVSFH